MFLASSISNVRSVRYPRLMLAIVELVNEPGRWNYDWQDRTGRTMACGNFLATSRGDAEEAALRVLDGDPITVCRSRSRLSYAERLRVQRVSLKPF